METLKLFYSSEVDEPGCELNQVFSLLDRLKELGVSYELVDTAQMDKGELHELYISEAVPPSVKKKYRIGHIFGTQRISGVYFGREQPGLLVYQKDAEGPTDVFPHTIKGRRTSITDFLEEKVAELKKED